jgi:exopolysaccharide biosynthesis protein
VALIDTAPAGVAIPRDGGVLVLRGVRSTSIRPGDTVRARYALEPDLWEAVGGRPRLVRDSAIVSAVDTEGGPGFATGRHPRTAVGIARGGKRLLLVVVDGRQKPYSDGMTLRELATLMIGLGARDAINLDGGGSTTMVIAAEAGGRKAESGLRIVNRPSDAAGERAVGNALAIVRGCSGA